MWETERINLKPNILIKQGYVSLGSYSWPCFLLSGESQNEGIKKKTENQRGMDGRKEGRKRKQIN